MDRIVKVALAVALLQIAFTGAAHAGYKSQTHCPSGMALIEGKYCIDKYEYPNKKGEYAMNAATWQTAARLCRQDNKRLCSRGEWENACRGTKNTKYPYGDDYRKGVCSDPSAADGQGQYPSGAWEECVSDFGVYDMSGNLWEWTSENYGGGTKGLHGGSAITDNQEAMSCGVPTMEDPGKVDNYIGFRCCKDLAATDVRTTTSPLVGYPLVTETPGFYSSTEYMTVEDIVNSTEMGAFVGAEGFDLTAGYQFENARIDFSRMEYKVNSALYGKADTSHATANVLHTAFLLPIEAKFGQWTGNFTAGARRLDSNSGWINEAYLSKEFNNDRWSLTPTMNYIESEAAGDRFGYSFDTRYRLTPSLNVMGLYGSADFYKSYLNNHIIPNSPNSDRQSCIDCDTDSASAGVIFMLPQARGGLYFLYYDIGDLNVPMGGTTIYF
jgi:hypothetical protein